MNFLNSQNKQKGQSSLKHNKKRLNQDQVKLLEESFDSNKKLEPECKFQLARDLGVPPRQVAIWYQNRRARWKSQSLEHDFSALQAELESALAEKKHLEKEMGKLKEELKRANEMLQGQHNWVSSFSPNNYNNNYSCCDERMSQNDDGGLYYDEELYASLVGAEDGSNTNSISSWENGKDFWV